MATLEVGDIVIEDVEIRHRVLYKEGITPRSYPIEMSFQQQILKVSNQTLRNIMVMLFNLTNNNLGVPVNNITRPVLVEYAQKFIGCSEKTAYNYANAMQFITTWADDYL